jgi:hypothetical protein
MTTQAVITLAKEKLGRDITEQEAQDYIDGKAAIPDEALDIVSGGGDCNKSNDSLLCPVCQQSLRSIHGPNISVMVCNNPNCSNYGYAVF